MVLQPGLWPWRRGVRWWVGLPMTDIAEERGVWVLWGPPCGGVCWADHEWHPTKQGQQKECPRGQCKVPKAGM